MKKAAPPSPLVQLSAVRIHGADRLLIKDLSWKIGPGEIWAICGASGSGKTTLLKALAGQHPLQGNLHRNIPSTAIAWVEQQQYFRNLSNRPDFYYQQRFQSADAADSLTVAEQLAIDEAALTDEQKKLLQTLQLSSLLTTPLIQLSNGEHKRCQLARALLRNPVFLILDQPFTGLDTAGRSLLNNLLLHWRQSGKSAALSASALALPDSVTHVAYLDRGGLSYLGPRTGFSPPSGNSGETHRSIPAGMLPTPGQADFDTAVKMLNTRVQYGEKVLLNNINWEVRKGEGWRVSGPNGAGKSTLLSLLTGDNPQAYANEIYLFGKRRGQGESIWEIKRRIGFVSPELHHYFDQGSTLFEVIASGWFDSIGLFRKLGKEQDERVRQWIRWLGMEDMENQLFGRLPISLQREALLARAFVKGPDLWILDEPCQGLDEAQTSRFLQLIDRLFREWKGTLIYVSHYATEVPACVTRELRLLNGCIQP